jgi:hypothetical protein
VDMVALVTGRGGSRPTVAMRKVRSSCLRAGRVMSCCLVGGSSPLPDKMIAYRENRGPSLIAKVLLCPVAPLLQRCPGLLAVAAPRSGNVLCI